MALGFGFNKAKVLAQAEKFVQQGKLSNAITEYEKIIKEDPKDLTVLNTVGDLYARTGNNDQATYYFKRVGDQYAQNGFTVKAIAIYKKLTKMSSYNADNTTKLAELYSQQGLLNDARVHYMMVADQLLKIGDNNQAARIFQKILELDPENAHTQAKLADLYTKLGKKEEARNIYYTAAESLYARGSHAAAEEALQHVLELDSSNIGALILRGMIAADAGNSQAAIEYLEQITDLDAHPDGLRALLRAKLQSGRSDGVDSIAGTLLMRHNDPTGVATAAQWYATNHHIENALRLYETHSSRMFAGNQPALQEALSPLVGRAQDNPAAMAIVNRLLNLTPASGDHAQTAEMIEQRAHAAAQKGSYAEARDLYQKLSEMEPENAHHGQNYKQMLVKLGEDSATRILTPDEAAQAFMVEELDESAPAVHQNYDPPTEKAIESALTDAELYVSYNVPSKAIPPLEAALPLAPQDVNLNQRLASLYVRSERFADAARLYQNLSEIYKELGHPSESAKYLEASKRYALRAPQSSAAAAMPIADPAKPARATWPPEPVRAAAPEPPPPAPFEVEIEPEAEPSVQEFTFDTPEVMIGEPEAIVATPVEPIIAEPASAEITLEPVHFSSSPASSAALRDEEIDISNEWDEMIEVEPVELAVQSAQETGADTPRVSEVELEPATPSKTAGDLSTQIADKIQEIRFYITQEMWDSAKSAILDLTELAPDAPEVTELIAQVSAGQSRPASTAATPAFIDEEAVVEPAPIELEAIKAEPVKVVEPVAPVAAKPKIEAPPVEKPKAEPSAPPSVSREKKKPVEEPAAFANDDLLDIAALPTAKPAPAFAAASANAQSTEDILGDFVLDLEQAPELADFVPKARSTPAPVAAPTPAVVSAPAMSRLTNGDMQDRDSANVLSDILTELQEETAEAAEPEEDPETHYNLGIAFKEMGLLDEAIGELQKVCHAVDRGAKFSQPIQALTWLAQCLVDKGAPEAAVRWYQKALHLPGLDDSSRCAIYYDLATAFEASGDKKSALANFMEVYGSNIDFRDVASRIKALKS